MKPIIIANWKLYLTPRQSIQHALALRKVARESTMLDFVVCPATPSLAMVGDAIKHSAIRLGVQNVDLTDGAAMTGAVSVEDCSDLGCRYVLVGHSERRALGETDAIINKKIKAVLDAKLDPILCIGETLKERQSGREYTTVRRQLRAALRGLRDHSRVTIAYEPVWAISGHRGAHDCSPEQAKEMLITLRKLQARYRIIYGGSVDAGDITSFFSVGYDGALVGHASTSVREYGTMVRMASRFFQNQ